MLIIGAGGLGVPAEMYLAADGIREEVYEEFRKIGFLFVTLDLKGYRLGSMNATLQLIKEAAAGGASRYIAGAFRLLRKMY